MPSCYVCKRSRNAKSKSANITFHRFPTKEIILQKWHDFFIKNNINVKNINKNRLICSSHFSPESFVIHKQTKILLKHAIPNIIISRVKNAKNNYCEVKKKIPIPKFRLEPSHGNQSTSNFQMKRILVKVSNTCNELPKDILPVPDLDTAATVAITSFETVEVFDSSSNPSKNISSPVNLDEVVQSKSLETFNMPTSTINVSDHRESFEILDLDETIISESSETERLELSISMNNSKSKRSFLAAASASDDDTPKCSYLKYGIRQLLGEIEIKNSKLKILQQSIRRKNKKIDTISKMLSSMKGKKTTTQNCINKNTNVLQTSNSDAIKVKNLKSNTSKSITDLTLPVTDELGSNKVVKVIRNEHNYTYKPNHFIKKRRNALIVKNLLSTNEVTNTLTAEDLLSTKEVAMTVTV